MAKRFTDTEKFMDPWYRRLSTKHKILWEYLLCYCDHAGIINIDLEFVEMVLKEKYGDNDLAEFFSERVVLIKPGKYFISKFIDFQYGKLNPASKVHASVMARLAKEGVVFNSLESGREYSLEIAYGNPIHSVKDKAKAKDKEKEKNKSALNNAIKPDQVIALWNSKAVSLGLPHAEVFLTSKGVSDFLEISGCLDLASKSWDQYFEKILGSEFLTKKKTGSTLSFSWALNPDNFSKVMNGAFEEKELSDEEAMAFLYSNRGF